MSEEERREVVRQRVELGYSWHAPPHPVRGGYYYLLTATCYQHAPLMQSGLRRKQLLDDLNHIHANPVKHGLVRSPYDWQASSVRWYLEHEGRAWLQDLWTRYPVRDYGRGWDEL